MSSSRPLATGAVPSFADDPRVVWSSAAWRQEVEAWIFASLGAAGLCPTGPVEQVRLRMWSVQLTVATDAGSFWFKENHPGQRFEAALLAVLAEHVPHHVVPPVAVEPARGWFLSPDRGDTISSMDGVDIGVWQRIVRDYADMQQRLASTRDEVAAAGLVTVSPLETADFVERATEQMAALPAAAAAHLDLQTRNRVRDGLPHLRVLGRRLADLPGGMSLQHNDLHPNNVFLPRPDEEHLRFFDFADAVWAHPFCSMSIPIRNLAGMLETQEDDPRIRSVVDAYLDAWQGYGSRAELVEALDVAVRLAPVHRFESWRRLLADATEARHPDHAENLRYWVDLVAAIR